LNKGVIYKPIRDLSEFVRTSKVSPVELAKTFLNRLENLGPKYNAVVTVTRERALGHAQRAEEEITKGLCRGPLHGIPFGVKDLLATSDDIPTTWGAAPFKDQSFGYDATVIRRLEESGGVLVAKLSMIELAGGMGYRQPHASFTGPPRNPWNPERWTGGSSSGSGASVAGGFVPYAIGSETWGSILSPANNCGVAGLRPTYGRVSRFGAMTLSWTLDKLGPLCLTADDCGLVLEAIAGPDPNDPTTTERPYRYDTRPIGRPFKLGLIKDALEGMEEDVKQNFEETLKVLEKVASIEEVEFPDLPYNEITRVILSAEAAAAFDEFVEEGKVAELTAPEDHFGPYARTVVLAKDYLRALRLRTHMARAAEEVMYPYDAIVAPTNRRVASPIDMEFRRNSTSTYRDITGAMGNGAGLPSISVPNGFNDEGLPTGIQFIGRAYDENLIIAVARTYQSMTDWHRRHPPELTP
jgi:aspartyl-tRNA(Asn)/glutamyl-tRNA(Gln) amidotransferase subunit A